jgi:hypothetical protein
MEIARHFIYRRELNGPQEKRRFGMTIETMFQCEQNVKFSEL